MNQPRGGAIPAWRNDDPPIAPAASGRGDRAVAATIASGLSARAEIALVAGAVALALALRIPGLGAGLWFDEIQTLIDYVRQPLGTIVTTFDSQNQHLLYSVLARISVSALGESAAALRLPALLFGIASLLAVYRLARAVAPRDEALLAPFALAVSYHHVWFSQDARGYTGLLLFSVLATTELHRLLTRSDAGAGTAARYAVWIALALYTHSTAAAVAAGHAVVVAAAGIAGWRRERRAPGLALGALAGGAALTLALYAPVLSQLAATLFGHEGRSVATEWQSPLWLLAETVRGLSRGLPGGWVAVAVAGAVALAGLASYWRQDRVLTGLMILPGLITAAVVIGTGHNLWPRFFFFSAGFAVMIAIRGGFVAGRMLLAERRWPIRAAAVLALIASALTVPRAWGPKQDYAGALAAVDRARGPADAVVTVDLTTDPYRRYYDRSWPEVATADSLERIERAHPRTWLLFTFPIRLPAVAPGIRERLAAAYDTVARFPGTVGDGTIFLMSTRPPAPGGSKTP
jgi:4-amino-4-deoxy-L-arabinose transferase-like glycosyltransferase